MGIPALIVMELRSRCSSPSLRHFRRFSWTLRRGLGEKAEVMIGLSEKLGEEAVLPYKTPAPEGMRPSGVKN